MRIYPTLALVGVGMLAVITFGTSADGPARASAQGEVERKNCPPGFKWAPMSGVCCIQEELPANGHLSYEGYSICSEGYVGMYEQRPTTDGQTVPGCPYKTFSYLLRCATPEEQKAGGTTPETSLTPSSEVSSPTGAGLDC